MTVRNYSGCPNFRVGAAEQNTCKDKINRPKDKINWPKDKINTPKDKINWPKDKINWPKDKINRPKDKINWPKAVAEISVGWGGGGIANLWEILILSEVRRHMSYSIKRLLYQNFRQINWRLLLTT